MAFKYFYLRDKSQKKTSIVAIMRFFGHRYKITTGESVETDKWLESSKMAKTGDKNPEGSFINERLRNLQLQIDNVIHRFKLDGVTPSQDEFKRAIDIERQGNKSSQFFLTDYIHNEIAIMRSERADGTIKMYTSAYNTLKKYEKERRRRLRFCDINMDFYNDYRNWLFTKEGPRKKSEGYSKNTFGSHIRYIIVFMNRGLKYKVHNCEGHKHEDFKVLKEEPDTIYLTNDELDNIYNLKITIDKVKERYPKANVKQINDVKKNMEIVRKRFLVGCYTLLRVSDYKRLTEVNIKEGFITMKPTKGGTTRKNSDVWIPMHPRVKELVKSNFDWNESLSLSAFNDLIKDVCYLAQINEKIQWARNEKGRLVEKENAKWELVSSHTARRTAATNMMLSGLQTYQIMQMGGWKTEQSFFRYIRNNSQINAQNIADHAYFRLK